MSLSFCLARASRPHLHEDRHTALTPGHALLSHRPDKQILNELSRSPATNHNLIDYGAGIKPQLELVKENSILYLGETCVFYITLSNQGNQSTSLVTAVTIKVEASVERGSASSVLYDNSASPLPQLPALGRQDVIVQTDIKEQGAITLVASAVFTDHLGERKYHVQFFKLTSASPLSVRTRVRCLPHIRQPISSSSSGGGSGGGSNAAGQASMSKASSRSSSERSADTTTRCFLEVSVENTTPQPLVLHAVRLLPAAGIQAQQLTLCGPSKQQQQQQQHHHHHHDQRQQQQQDRGHLANKPAQAQMSSAALQNGGSDTQLLHDIGDEAACSSQQLAAATAVGSPSVAQQRQQQQQQHKQLLNGFTEQLHIHHQDQQQQQDDRQQRQQHDRQQQTVAGSSLGPLLADQQADPLVVVPPGGSYNHLWQVDHHMPLERNAAGGSSGAAAAAALAGPGSSSGSGSSTVLGRLELHWSNYDGKTGRLLTQPLSGPVPASGREVLLQLTQLLPAAAAAADGTAGQQQQQAPFPEDLAVGELVRATFTLTVAAAASSSSSSSSSGWGSGQQHAAGPLLVLYTELSPSGPAAAAAAAAGSGSSSTSRPSSSSSSSNGRGHPDVAVQGIRSQRIARLLPGQSVGVDYVLLPLRRGWVRLPTFVVVCEADGRLLDSVHDVQLLVV